MNSIKKFTALATLVMVMVSASAYALDAPKTEEEKTLYTIGLIIARQLRVFNLSPAELERVKQGVTDGATAAKPAVEIAEYNTKVQELAKARIKVQSDKLVAVGREMLDKASKEKGAVRTDSGIVYIPLKEGKGDSPKATDTVKVNYKGTLHDGTEFDSSYKRGKPAEFKLNGVIKCWTEGLQKMKPAGKATLVCPAATAYGDKGMGDILPGSTLQFEVELLEVIKN